jgi:FkbM family methyltransferase
MVHQKDPVRGLPLFMAVCAAVFYTASMGCAPSDKSPPEKGASPTPKTSPAPNSAGAETTPPAPAKAGPSPEEDPTLLAPRLLKDTQETEKYIAEFPFDAYKVFQVDDSRFFLDELPDFIKNYIRHGVEWEPQLVPHLKAFAKKGTTVIDAGAHIGVHTVALARAVGPNGRVYAFEPQKKLHRELHQNLRLNHLPQAVALRFALGAEPGIIEMAPPTKGNEGGTGIGSGGDKAELRTLDSFQFKNVSFLKIDVEHFEIPVIQGATALIKRERPVILVEILGGVDVDRATPEQKAQVQKTQDLLRNFGYIVKKVGYYDYLALPRERYLKEAVQPGIPATPDLLK